MVKIIAIMKRKPGMTLEKFDDYWEEKHGLLVARIAPSLRRYVQNHHYTYVTRMALEIDGVM